MDVELAKAKNKVIAKRKKELQVIYELLLVHEAKLKKDINEFQGAQLGIRGRYVDLLSEAFMATDMKIVGQPPRAVVCADNMGHSISIYLEQMPTKQDGKEEKHKCAEQVALEFYKENWPCNPKKKFCDVIAATQLPCFTCATELAKAGVKLVIFTDYTQDYQKILDVLRSHHVSYIHIPRFEVSAAIAHRLYLNKFSRGDDETELEATIRAHVHFPELTFAPIPKHCPSTPKELPIPLDFYASLYK